MPTIDENHHREFAEVTAQGEQTPDLSTFNEKGVNVPITYLDNIPELRSRQQANRVYSQILKNDSQTRTALRACSIPILGAQWFIEPGGDEQVDLDAQSLVETNLFAGGGMTTTWLRVLEHAVKFMSYGHSIVESVYERREWRPPEPNRNTRNHIMLRKLAPRPAATIKEFLYDSNGGPRGIVQTVINPAEKTQTKPRDIEIPIQKLVIFTFDQEGGNLEGNSLIRTAYRHVYYKDNFYKIDGVQKERHGIGVPYGKPPPGYTDKDLEFAAEMLSSVRANEKSFMIEPPGWEFGFKEIPGNQVDALESAQHHDLMIARNVLVQFINMGQGSGAGGVSGARATSGTMLDLFLKSLRHTGNLIAEYFNTYLIPQLVSYNFEVDQYPKLKVRRIGENRDLQMFAAALRNIGDYITVDDETEEWVREEFDMPTTFDKSQRRGAKPVKLAPGAQPDDEEESGVKGKMPTGTQPKPVNAAE